MTNLDVSVVIPARNAAKTLAEQLDALKSQTSTRRWEVVLVDNWLDGRHPCDRRELRGPWAEPQGRGVRGNVV